MAAETIFLPLIPAFIAFNNSPMDTTSAPEPIFFNSLSRVRFELDLTEKHIIGLTLLNAFNLWEKFQINWNKMTENSLELLIKIH